MSEPQDKVVLPEDLQEPSPGIDSEEAAAGEQSLCSAMASINDMGEALERIEMNLMSALSNIGTTSADKIELKEQKPEGENTDVQTTDQDEPESTNDDDRTESVVSSLDVIPSTAYIRYSGSQEFQKRCRMLDMNIQTTGYDSDSSITSFRAEATCMACGQLTPRNVIVPRRRVSRIVEDTSDREDLPQALEAVPPEDNKSYFSVNSQRWIIFLVVLMLMGVVFYMCYSLIDTVAGKSKPQPIFPSWEWLLKKLNF